jgi:cytochrome c551/c552
MKKTLVGMSMVALLACQSGIAAAGKFEEKCGSCHSGAVGPKKADVAAAYKGKKAELAAFLDGKGQPVVPGFADNSGKVSMMKSQIGTTVKNLSAADRALIEKELSE